LYKEARSLRREHVEIKHWKLSRAEVDRSWPHLNRV